MAVKDTETTEEVDTGRPPWPVWVTVLLVRTGVLIVDYVVVMLTAFLIIPMLGIFSYERSGVSARQTSLEGQISVWLVPFVFLVVMVAVGEVAALRALWRWATRRIDHVRAIRNGTAEIISVTPPSGKAVRIGKPSIGNKASTRSKRDDHPGRGPATQRTSTKTKVDNATSRGQNRKQRSQV